MSTSQVKLGSPEAMVFPEYRNRKQYKELTGKDAPPFDPTRKLKFWEDPSALTSNTPRKVYYNCLMVTDAGVIVVENNIPVHQPVILSKAEAATVNLPEEDEFGNTGSLIEWLPAIPAPHRDLLPGEILIAWDDPETMPGDWAVYIRNVAAWEAEQVAKMATVNEFTAKDRQLLQAIAKKLGL